MLTIENLRKIYNNNLILDNLNLQIVPGEIYGLLGPNGAGKTTTINIICNLLLADSGVVKINDEVISHKTKYLIGVVPQENLLYQHLTCEENLGFYGKIYGLNKKKLKQRIEAVLTAVRLKDRKDSLLETLSGGMKKRMNIAVALIHQPKLLILDEPTTGLDIESRHQIWQLIQNLSQQGITILLTTHLLDEAQHLCQRIGILKAGKLIAEGSLAQLRKLIPAEEIVVIKTCESEKAIARGKSAGFTQKNYGGNLAFWLPEPWELKKILTYFDGISLDSISKQSVQLEHIYLEITQSFDEKTNIIS